MATRLTMVTVLLCGVALAFAAFIAKELTSAPRRAAPRPQPAASVAGAPAAPAPTPAPATPAAGGAANYSVVATRNLFSPTRSEAPVTPAATAPAAAAAVPKPSLFGVVLQDGAPIAYLEDPVTKRVARYRIGDTVAGGTVKTIGADSVVLSRPEGPVTVRLHDPTRPRAAAPPAAVPTPKPGAPTATPPQGFVPGGGAPSGVPSFRRPLPPGVLGRIPPQPANAAPSK
jgi:hypothetical protein